MTSVPLGQPLLEDARTVSSLSLGTRSLPVVRQAAVGSRPIIFDAHLAHPNAIANSPRAGSLPTA
jgi:hypothetical protein